MKAGRVARLTSALLVKKGNAAPASYGQPVQSLSSFLKRSEEEGRRLEVVPTARQSTPRRIEVAHEPPVPRTPPPRKPALSRRMRRDSRARLGLRLEGDAYLRLKLVAAHRRCTLQQVLIDALDHYLETVAPSVPRGRCACLEAGAGCADVPPGGCSR